APSSAAIYTLSLHDALPISVEIGSGWYLRGDVGYSLETSADDAFTFRTFDPGPPAAYSSDGFDTVDLSEGFNFGLGFGYQFNDRSEEHTSELQSRENLVCRL